MRVRPSVGLAVRGRVRPSAGLAVQGRKVSRKAQAKAPFAQTCTKGMHFADARRPSIPHVASKGNALLPISRCFAPINTVLSLFGLFCTQHNGEPEGAVERSSP